MLTDCLAWNRLKAIPSWSAVDGFFSLWILNSDLYEVNEEYFKLQVYGFPHFILIILTVSLEY